MDKIIRIYCFKGSGHTNGMWSYQYLTRNEYTDVRMWIQGEISKLYKTKEEAISEAKKNLTVNNSEWRTSWPTKF